MAWLIWGTLTSAKWLMVGVQGMFQQSVESEAALCGR